MTGVKLHRPEIDGDTVWFRWDDDSGLPEPVDGGLFFRYDGIDLAQFSDELWLEVFLATRLRSWALLDRPVHIELPFAVPHRTARFWQTYYEANQVMISPLSVATTYSPWRHQPPTPRYRAAVFFGGGLDSFSTACLLGERYGRGNVLLIQIIDPHQKGEELRHRMFERHHRLSMEPAQRLGFCTQAGSTNLHAIALRDGSGPFEPHIEQYTAGQLPVLLAHGIPVSTFGYSWNEYIWHPDTNGILAPRFLRSRPEMLAAQSNHYRQSLGFKHHVLNLNLVSMLPIGFRLLGYRYPDAFPSIFTCQNTGERWCYHCKRCVRYALLLLEHKLDDPAFDLRYLFAKSRYVHRIVNEFMSATPPSPGKNIDWSPTVSTWLNYPQWVTSFHRIDLDYARSVLDQKGFGDLQIMKAMLGVEENPISYWVPERSFDHIPDDLSGFLRPIIEQYGEIWDFDQAPLQLGDREAFNPFHQAIQHPLLELTYD